jgi:hypothetical protein
MLVSSKGKFPPLSLRLKKSKATPKINEQEKFLCIFYLHLPWLLRTLMVMPQTGEYFFTSILSGHVHFSLLIT